MLQSFIMIGPHFAALRQTLEESDHLPAETKAELLRLVEAAEAEASGELPENASAEDVAESETTVFDQLKQSIEELESSHPEAAAAFSRVANVLGNMGI